MDAAIIHQIQPQRAKARNAVHRYRVRRSGPGNQHWGRRRRAARQCEREVSGIMADETPGSITLRAAGGREETLLRSDLKNLRSSGLSIMPEGFEKSFQPQDMADLLALLQGR